MGGRIDPVPKVPRALAKHFNIQLYAVTVVSMNHTTQGHARVREYMYVVFQMKGWNGKGDLELQASLYPLEAFRPVIQNKQDLFNVLPCIIVYCTGGCSHCLAIVCLLLIAP